MYKKKHVYNQRLEIVLKRTKVITYTWRNNVYNDYDAYIGTRIFHKKSDRTKPQISHDKNVIFV